MKQETELPEDLCADEAVCFIADRHHVTPQQLLRHFLYGEAPIPLEDNEVEILKGLSKQNIKGETQNTSSVSRKTSVVRTYSS